MSFRNVSVRERKGTIIEIKVVDCFDSHQVLFHGQARIGNQKEMGRLLEALEAKGFLERKETGWW